MVGNLTLLSVFHLVARWKLNFPLRGSILWGGVLWFSRKIISSLPCWFSFAPSRGWVFWEIEQNRAVEKHYCLCRFNVFNNRKSENLFYYFRKIREMLLYRRVCISLFSGWNLSNKKSCSFFPLHYGKERLKRFLVLRCCDVLPRYQMALPG